MVISLLVDTAYRNSIVQHCSVSHDGGNETGSTRGLYVGEEECRVSVEKPVGR